MKQRDQDVGLALLYIVITHLLCWLAAYINEAGFIYMYWIGILPFYFLLRYFSKQKVLFWGVALGGHLLFSCLSYWLIVNGEITGWDRLGYLISWLCTVGITGVTLFLDAIILSVKAIVKKNRSKAAQS